MDGVQGFQGLQGCLLRWVAGIGRWLLAGRVWQRPLPPESIFVSAAHARQNPQARPAATLPSIPPAPPPPRRGKYAQLLSEAKPFTEEEGALFDAASMYAYESFRNKAASSRGMEAQQMEVGVGVAVSCLCVCVGAANGGGGWRGCFVLVCVCVCGVVVLVVCVWGGGSDAAEHQQRKADELTWKG